MELSKRKKNRLTGYDYSQNEAYFVTICVAEKQELLWNVGARDARPYNIDCREPNERCCHQTNRLLVLAKIFTRPHPSKRTGIPKDMGIYRHKPADMGEGLLLQAGVNPERTLWNEISGPNGSFLNMWTRRAAAGFPS